MVEIQIEGNKYDIPTDWSEITLEYWCGFYNIIKKYTKKDEEKEKKGEVSEFDETKLEDFEMLKMNRDMFQYMTGISDAMLDTLDINSMNDAIKIIGDLLQEYEPKDKDSFDFEGEKYYFPKEFLKRNTFGDYIEASQLDMYIDMMKHGRFDVIPEQMAILCRTATEKYDEDAIDAKAEKFKQLKMDTVWEFAFFLKMQSVKLTRTFRTFLGKTEEEVEEVKAEFLQLDSTTNS
tara:strand:- start:1187 stop:1888 length:702 start_codon:yes stop_codon:yes gene_type:complete